MAKRATNTDKETLVELWTKRVEGAKKDRDIFDKQADSAWKAYYAERDGNKPEVLFPIWWSTLQVLKSAVFARMPSPDVRSRYTSQPGEEADSDAKVVGQVVERAITFTMDTQPIYEHADRAITDYLACGLGCARVVYEVKVDTDAQGEPSDVAYQCVRIEYYPWNRVIWETTKDWEDVDWLCFEHYLTRKEIKARFRQDVDDAPEQRDKKQPDGLRVWEILDRTDRSVTVICEGHDEALEVRKDALSLKSFFPMPPPMMTNVQQDNLLPKPDYEFVRKLVEQVQVKTQRILNLTKQVKDVGFYDASLAELAQIQDAPDGSLTPIAGLLDRLNKTTGRADFDSVVAKQDNRPKVETIKLLVESREMDKQQIFEATGIADIVRGASKSDETATAQQIKGQWANVRLGPKQRCIAYWWRDIFRKWAEIIAEHFTPEQLYYMTGVQLTPRQIALLKSEIGRTLTIDVETDATTAQDEQVERQSRLELLKTTTEYMNAFLPAIQAQTLPADVAKEFILFAVRSFRHGRELEDVLQALPGTSSQLAQAAQTTAQWQQQAEQLQGQVQQMQKAVQEADAQEQARKEADTASNVKLREAQTAKTYADAGKTHAEAQVAGVEAQAKVIGTAAEVREKQARAVVAEKDVQERLAPKRKVKRTQLIYDDAGNPAQAITVEDEDGQPTV